MQNNKDITLFHSVLIEENKKAIHLIKSMLIDYKELGLTFNTAINNISNHFFNLEKENVTSRSDLYFLLDVFEKGKKLFEKGKDHLAISLILKPKFEEIIDLKITFEEYITQLAVRESFSEVRRNFENHDILYEAMYIIDKFESFENLPKFDIRRFQLSGDDLDLFNEVTRLAKSHNQIKKANLENVTLNKNIIIEEVNKIRQLGYPLLISINKNNDLANQHKIVEPKIIPFTFHKEYVAAMRSKKIYNQLEGDYFNDLTTTYNDYLNTFFDDPQNVNSNIQLDCSTQMFARLIFEMKNQLFKTINYKDIERCNLFTTMGDKILIGNNISNSSKNATDVEIEIVNNTIAYIKRVSEDLKR